jgi:hypothetical protein
MVWPTASRSPAGSRAQFLGHCLVWPIMLPRVYAHGGDSSSSYAHLTPQITRSGDDINPSLLDARDVGGNLKANQELIDELEKEIRE